MSAPALGDVPAAIRDAYDPDRFRGAAQAIVETLAAYLARAEARELPVLPPLDPPGTVAAWAGIPQEGGADPAALVARALEASNHLHHPRFVGHQVSVPLPLAAAVEAVSALLNNGMAVYEMGPVGVAVERAALRWMAGKLGLPEGASGVFTSGGSAGNLTALLAARQAKAGFDPWNDGLQAGPPLAILASIQAHYSVGRAAQILGLGKRGFEPVPVDAAFRLRPDALGAAFDRAVAAGRRPIAVVASACSTATGSFDPLDAIADFCEARGLWLHVDGAHGAAAALSPRHRQLLRGVERADSVVWDAHKLLLVPALSTAVLFKDGARSGQAFAPDAPYLFEDHEAAAYDVGARTLECTKRMLALPLYVALHTYGERLFEAFVERAFDLGAAFARLLRGAGDFEVPVEPACNIVCFRHLPGGVADLDAHQARVRAKLLASGAFYLVQVRLPAGLFLRVTLQNPLTTVADLEALVAAIRSA